LPPAAGLRVVDVATGAQPRANDLREPEIVLCESPSAHEVDVVRAVFDRAFPAASHQRRATSVRLDPEVCAVLRLERTLDLRGHERGDEPRRLVLGELLPHLRWFLDGCAFPEHQVPRHRYTSTSMRSGASSRSLTATRNDTASRPSTTR